MIQVSCFLDNPVYKYCNNDSDDKNYDNIVRNIKLWNKKTTLNQYISLFDNVTKKVSLLITY